MKTQQNESIQTAWIYSTVKQFAERYPAFTVGGLRHQIFHEDTNGLKKSGAIVRNGRKVLINESKYFAWVESQNNSAREPKQPPKPSNVGKTELAKMRSILTEGGNVKN